MSDFERLKEAVCQNKQFQKYSNYEGYAEVIAEYLVKKSPENIIEQLSENKHPFYIVNDFLKNDLEFKKHQILMFDNLKELLYFSPEKKNTTGLFLKDGKQKQLVEGLSEICDGDFFTFVQQLPNFIGIHSNARIGTIKKASVNGVDVIFKINSARKPERFINEQKAVQSLNELGITKSKLSIKKKNNQAFTVRLLDYLAIIKDYETGNCYSVSKEVKLPTAEEILIESRDYEIREQILSDMTRLIDYFFKKGIIWHDIAPRNILIKQKASGNEYTILDFERTKFQDTVSEEDINNFFRESFCIEEFSVICSAQEIARHFKKYYAPRSWDLKNKSPVSLNNPKKDYLEILKRRGIENPSQGEYDRFEQENIKIRFPFKRLNEKVFPLHLSFKVNHFFDFFVDLDVMELMMYAKANNCFYELIKYFSEYMNKIDELLFIEDFLQRTGQKTTPITEQKKSLENQFLEIVKKLKKMVNEGNGITEFIKNFI